jgi:hypothetical protein
MTPEPKPRIDEHGVGWCSAHCPSFIDYGPLASCRYECKVMAGCRELIFRICEPWAREMASMEAATAKARERALEILHKAEEGRTEATDLTKLNESYESTYKNEPP